jgi:hypothetical protein
VNLPSFKFTCFFLAIGVSSDECYYFYVTFITINSLIYMLYFWLSFGLVFPFG